MICACRVWHGVYHRAGFPENAGGRDSYFVGLGPAIRQVFKKNRNIIVGIRARIATRP